jgi:Rrf2 family protein
MFILSQRARYTLKSLLMLSRTQTGRPLQTTEIANSQRIPKRFLEIILLELRRHGIIHNIRGPGGGYVLTRPATKISLAEVIRASDGPLASLPCIGSKTQSRCNDCTDDETCEIQRILREVWEAASTILEKTSLAETASLFRAIEQPDVTEHMHARRVSY